VRILIRPRWPVLMLLLFAPAIPELLTGSTPAVNLVLNPPGFLLGFGGDILLYGCGALLIREFVVYFRKGWASVLLLGAAYGIAEEGFTVHTFFQRTGAPVNALGTYGHAFGVNWLWALGLTVFHATYSIALPILLTRLWYPEVRSVRWLDRGAVGLATIGYLSIVLIGGSFIGHGPSPAALALFLAICAVLILLAWRLPADFLSVRPGPGSASRRGLWLAGAAGFGAWYIVLAAAGIGRWPAVGVALVLIAIDLAALGYVRRYVGTVGLERSEFRFAMGMMAILFAWAGLVLLIDLALGLGIVAVAAIFAYLLHRLDRRIDARSPGAPAAPVGASV